MTKLVLLLSRLQQHTASYYNCIFTVMISDNSKYSCHQQWYHYVCVCTTAGYCCNSVTGNTAAANKSGCSGSCSSSGSTTATAAEWRDPDSAADSDTEWRDSADSGMCCVSVIRGQQLFNDVLSQISTEKKLQ
jgi:hypothetical protein